MKVRPLALDCAKGIENNRKFLDDLCKYTDIDLGLMQTAIHHMTFPPHECHEVFSKTPKIIELKENDPDEYKQVVSARKALSTLLNNLIITEEEHDYIKSMAQRIEHYYEIDLIDRIALLNIFRSTTYINTIEDYKDYSDCGFGWEIDTNLNTEQQCEGKLITMLYQYIIPRAEKINALMPIGHEKDYNQKDVFELIAEILNLRWLDKYDYEKIRNIYGNFQKSKVLNK